MSDTCRRYRAIKQALMQFYQPCPTGHRERHLNTLIAMICGLVGGQRAHLSTIADHAPTGGTDQESVMTRFRRWLKHDAHTLDSWFLPVAAAALATLAQQPLTLVMDSSVVGRGCRALMLSVVYHGRALPLAWVVVQGKKGHFPQATQCALLEQIQPLIPPSAHVTLLGDGEFDGTDVQAMVRRLQLAVCLSDCSKATHDRLWTRPPHWRLSADARRAACGAAGVGDGGALWSGQHSSRVGGGLRGAPPVRQPIIRAE